MIAGRWAEDLSGSTASSAAIPTVLSGTDLRQSQVEPEKTPEEGYHLTEDLVDKAISFIADAKQVAPDKPFFMYFCPGAMHAPHHVPKEWADKYKGKFDDGWDAYREKTFARQKELGIIPPDAELSRHDPGRADWGNSPPMSKALRPHDGGVRRISRRIPITTTAACSSF